MKTIGRLILAVGGIFLLLAASGCSYQDNIGYPETVKMAHRGDTMAIYGYDPLFHFEILDSDGNGVSSWSVYEDDYDGIRPDSISVSYKWLTVKVREDRRRMILIAKPSTSKKSRHLYIYRELLPNEYTKIKVVQIKK